MILAVRTSRPLSGGRAQRSLDVHAPTGGRQVNLAFTCAAEDYVRWEPEFGRWLQTLTFARAARPPQQLSDRLWTPILTGAVVGLLLLALYKWRHRGG